MEKDYTVSYITGGGEKYQDGVWTVKKTPKTMTAEKIYEYMSGIYAMHNVGEKIKIGVGTGSPIRDEDEDGSFTVYFKQAGTPYIFTPLEGKPPEKNQTKSKEVGRSSSFLREIK